MKKKKLLSLFICVALLITLLPTTAFAVDVSVTYIDANGTPQTVNATPITASSDYLDNGWYVVDSTFTRSGTITVTGAVYLILADDTSLTVTGNYGNAGVMVSADNSLTIYGQDLGTGTLIATGDNYGAGIGGGNSGSVGKIDINGGIVTAKGGNYGAGIGGGDGASGGTITINGGTVTATGGSFSAGIGGGGNGGGGNGGSGGTITINGGTVTAKAGTNSAGIGGGSGSGGGAGGIITINGGTVTATGSTAAAGIGGGSSGAGGIINIDASYAVVMAASRSNKAAIDAATSSSGSVINAKLSSELGADSYLKCDGNVLKLPVNYQCFAFSATGSLPVGMYSDQTCTTKLYDIVTDTGGALLIPLSDSITSEPTLVRKPGNDATLKASSTVKGQTMAGLGTSNATLGSETAGSVTITAAKAANTSNEGTFITLFDKNDTNAIVKVVKYAAGGSTENFATDAVYANEAIAHGDFFIIKVIAEDTTTVNYYRINVSIALEGAYSATASAYTLTPAAGINDLITFTVKDTLGGADTSFTGDKTVTVTGYQAAPDTSYGSIEGNSIAPLEADGSTDVTVTFIDGVGTAKLKLNKAAAQTIGFSIAGVNTPATNNLAITPTHGTAASMVVTQNITAPASNGGQFAQQPKVTLKDAYGNICTGDNSTVITAYKKDAGTWTLTGTATATASSGVATFTGLGAINTAQVSNAQLAFNSGSLTEVTSATVTLPVPAPHTTATASANTLTPAAGVNDQITFTVKDTLGGTDTSFTGDKTVTVTGYQAALDTSYGSIEGNSIAPLEADGTTDVTVTFIAGVGTANLKLNKAAAQTIGFSIAGVDTPATNNLAITPTHGTASSMAVTQNITAPASNGGQFAQQPKVTLKDAYGNICTGDNSTVITAYKKDTGTWMLTGTATATASSGVATFTGLGAINTAQVSNAQLAFNSGSLTEVTSATVALPAPAPHETAAAAANTLTPAAGVNDQITFTVKDTLGNTDTSFMGDKTVTVTGYQAAPDTSYGSIEGNSIAPLEADGSTDVTVTFIDGVGTAKLKLNKAAAQTIGFSIAGVDTPATNNLAITPTHGTASSMVVTQNITAPASNGGQFAQQPKVTLKDAYGNICTGDNSTVITAYKKDAGTWTLTGTATATASSGVATFTGLGATNTAQVSNAQLAFNSGSLTEVTSATVTLPAPAPHATAAAAANTLTPAAGVNDQITFTVKDTLGNTDTSFMGDKTVTVTGYQAAPDTSYGSMDATTLTGASTDVTVTFTAGIGTAKLKLNKASAQTIGFSLAGVDTPATNTLVITPTPGTAAAMAVTQNITAPASNGGQFAQQPKVTLKDAYGNICTGDNSTVVTAAKEDAGTWALTGTTTATANAGVATFTNLGATNTVTVNNAQLSFTSGVGIKVTSTTVTLPAPVLESGGGSSGGRDTEDSPTPTPTSSQDTIIVIVNGKEQYAGKETKTTEDGKSTVIIEVDNKVIDSKIDEAIKNNTTGTGNAIQVQIADMKSEVAKVKVNGDIVKKLELNTFDVSIKRDDVEYIIPAEEFTISKVAEQLDVSETDLEDIKVEVKIMKLDETVVEKYNEVAKANGAKLVFPPVSFEVIAKTTKANGSTGIVEISRFSNYVERVMEIPAGVDLSKITTGIVFNPDGTYSHVPTEGFQKDGKWYARINSLTNSVYSVIWNPITVKSVENHWSKDAVNDMASRLVIFNSETFAPDKSITRAEFAEYIVRALGLYREGSTHVNRFKDVSEKGDRALAILIANEYGIVSGYLDGTFKPNALITREEAMAMYQRAMKVTKLTGSDTNRYKSYTDFANVSTWATSCIREVLSAHVFNGTTATTISPKSNLTYAEAAQAIKNLLVESKLINK